MKKTSLMSILWVRFCVFFFYSIYLSPSPSQNFRTYFHRLVHFFGVVVKWMLVPAVFSVRWYLLRFMFARLVLLHNIFFFFVCYWRFLASGHNIKQDKLFSKTNAFVSFSTSSLTGVKLIFFFRSPYYAILF